MSLIPNLLLRGVSQALSVAKVYWLMSIPWHPTELTSAGIQEYMPVPANV